MLTDLARRYSSCDLEARQPGTRPSRGRRQTTIVKLPASPRAPRPARK